MFGPRPLACLGALLAAASLHAAAPSAPTGLVASADTGIIGLNWDDTTDATTYRIYQADSASGPWTLLATRDRSRHLVANAPAGTTRYYRVTAVNASNEESAVSATANSLDRPATSGNFRIGSSFVTDSDRLQRFLTARSLTVATRRFQVIGAPLEYIWSNTLSTDPTRFNSEMTQLQSGSYDALVMNAQRPFSQGERELEGTVLFAEEALAARPGYRVFIHEYWNTELPDYNTWAETLTAGNRARQQQWYSLSSVALAYEATTYLGTPVYIAPIGTAVESAKQAATSGQLQAYTTREAFHATATTGGAEHLNNLGKYLQEGVVAAGAYQIDVRGTHNWVDTSTTLSSSDAAVLQQIIHDTVRNTPFSGWHTGAPATLAGYLQAMRDALATRESFDDFTATGSGSVSNPRNGLTWSFTGVNGYADGFGGTRAEYPVTRLDRKIRLNANGTLTTTLRDRLIGLSVRLRRTGTSGASQLRLSVNGAVIGTVTNDTIPSGTDILYGREFPAVSPSLAGSTLEIRNTGSIVVELDDLIWESAPAITSASPATAATRGVPYAHTFTAVGSQSIPVLALSGSLPAGLSFNPSTGQLAGTPSAAGSYSLTFSATDSDGDVSSQPFTLTVTDPFVAWLSANYPGLTGNDALATANPDGDALPNLLEYALGTNPTLPAASPVTAALNLENKLQLSFTPQAVAGLTYVIQASSDLGTWTDTHITSQLTVGTPYTYTDSTPVSGRRFLRLKVNQ